MRRFAALLAAAVLLLTACGKKQPELEEPKNNNRAAVMTIVRTEFSQETEDILKLLINCVAAGMNFVEGCRTHKVFCKI